MKPQHNPRLEASEAVSDAPSSARVLPERVLAGQDRARWHDWGLREFGEILTLQERLRGERRDDAIPDTWLAGEHETVITLGARGDEKRDIVGFLSEQPGGLAGGLPTFRIDRGGQATIHNPGQLVIYPIVRTQVGLLAQARLSRALLETTRDWLARRCGVELEIPRGRPGLFFGERKVAAIGVSIRRRVSMHGIAVNLCNDLTPWKQIIACGEPQTRPMTMSEILGREIKPAELMVDFENWLRGAWGYATVERMAGSDGG